MCIEGELLVSDIAGLEGVFVIMKSHCVRLEHFVIKLIAIHTILVKYNVSINQRPKHLFRKYVEIQSTNIKPIFLQAMLATTYACLCFYRTSF